MIKAETIWDFKGAVQIDLKQLAIMRLKQESLTKILVSDQRLLNLSRTEKLIRMIEKAIKFVSNPQFEAVLLKLSFCLCWIQPKSD